MIEQRNNGDGFHFRSDAGAKIYERIMKTSTGNRLARYGARDFATNFDATQVIKREIDGLCDAVLLRDGESVGDNYTAFERAAVYLAGVTGFGNGSAARWANSRAKGRLKERKRRQVDAKLEGLVGHCSKLTSNCDAVIGEIDEKIDSVTGSFYEGLGRSKNLKTVISEYESRVEEIGEEIPECPEKDSTKRLQLERELSGLRRDHTGVMTELDDASFQVQMCERELQELDNTAAYLFAVRSNNAKSEQRYRFLLHQARRKHYNLSPLVVDAGKLVEGDQLAKEQARTDALYSKVMGKVVELISATFGTPLPPSKGSTKDFMKMRKEEVERVKREFDSLIKLEQERLNRMLEV